MEEKIYLQCMTLHRFTSDLITDTRTIKWHYTNESQDLSDALFEKKKKHKCSSSTVLQPRY